MTDKSAEGNIPETLQTLKFQLDTIGEALNASQDGFAIWKAVYNSHKKLQDFTLVLMNTTGAEAAGRSQSELVGMSLTEVVGLETAEGLRSLFQRSLREGQSVSEIVPGIDAHGVQGYFENTVVPFGRDLVFATYRDVSDAEHEHTRLLWLAEHDYLTGMPNRSKLHDSLRGCVSAAKKNGTLFGFVFIDIDYFKEVNDTYGHDVGDALLVNFVKRIRNSLPETALVARIAGDEFAILIDRLKGEDQLTELMNEVFAAMSRPFVHAELEISITCSAGCVLNDGSEHPDEIMRVSDKAMYEAKHNGRARFIVQKVINPI